MDPHHIQLPREVTIGTDALKKVPQILDKNKLKGPSLLISGPKTFKIAGEDVKEILEDHGYVVDIEIVSKSEPGRIQELINEAQEYGFLIGIGGGRIIDTVKYSATKSDKPYVSVPTAPSHDGITSSRVSLDGINDKHSRNANSPNGIVIDTNIISEAPSKLIAAGCGDLISNITAVEDWKLANKDIDEYYSDYSAALSVLSANIIIKTADEIKQRNERGIRNLVKSLLSAGIAMSIAGSSRPCSGAEHQFSHALDDLYDRDERHGIQCAIGTLISAYLHDMDWKNLKQVMEKLGIPTTIEQIPYDKDELVEAWHHAPSIRDRYTVLNREVNNNINVENVLSKVGII